MPHSPGRVVIDKIETCLVDLPTIRPHKLAMTVMDGQTLMLVRVFCSDGTVGWGEGTTIGGLAYGAESPESMKVNIDRYIAPLLIGQDAHAVAAAMNRVYISVRDNRFAKSAVETALFDALGSRTCMAVSELLGGRLRDRLPVVWTLASGDTQCDIDEGEKMLDSRRHRVFKLKIGRRSVEEDVAHVAALKKAFGERAELRVDVNMAWSEAQAHRGLAALADVGCELAEQPVASPAALARLTQARYSLAVMADESLTGPASAFELARITAADVFAIKIEQSGGLLAAQRVAAIADAAGVELYGGTMLEGAIGTAASAQVFATLPHLVWGTELFGPLLVTEEILAEPLRYADFHLTVPNGPGLGLTLDMDRVTFFRRDRNSVSVAVQA